MFSTKALAHIYIYIQQMKFIIKRTESCASPALFSLDSQEAASKLTFVGQSVPCPAPAALHHVMPSALLRVRLVKFLQEKKGKAFILQGQHHVQILCITGKMISQDITMTYFTF